MGGREEDWPEGTKEAVLGPDGADSLAKPLQPQYSGNCCALSITANNSVRKKSF